LENKKGEIYCFVRNSSLQKSITGIGILAGFVLVLPLFLEPEIEREHTMEYTKFNLSHALLVSEQIWVQ
jgi:hypothetical protein